jgi:hypothetical protein
LPAETGTLSFATVDSSGTLGSGPTIASLATATSLAATNANVASLQSLTASHTTQLNQLFRDGSKAREGIAMAWAMESPALARCALRYLGRDRLLRAARGRNNGAERARIRPADGVGGRRLWLPIATVQPGPVQAAPRPAAQQKRN